MQNTSGCTIGVGRLAGIRIARISTVPYFVLSQLKFQIETIGSAGAEVVIVTGSGPEFPSLQAIDKAVCEQVEIPRSISPWLDIKALLALYLFFRRNKIDIAHSTTPKAGLLTAVAAFLAGIPIRLHTFTGQQWLNMKGFVRWASRASDWLIARLNTRCYADSASQRQFLIDEGLIPPGKLFVLGAGSLAGVDLDRFDPERFPEQGRHDLRKELGIPPEASVLLFVGRITGDKGVNELLSAFRQLRTEESAAHLILAGHLDSEIGGIGLARQDIEGIPQVHIVGYTDFPEKYMSIADILCLPSYREGFGTVIIEAAAMGVPAVGTRIYGLSDAVVDGETGILVPPRDVPALAEALKILLKDEQLRMKMGLAARVRCATFFDAKRVSGMLLEEYSGLLESAGIQPGKR